MLRKPEDILASEDFSWAMKLEEVGRVVAGAASFRSGLLVV